MGFVLSFIKIKDYPQHRQVCLTVPLSSHKKILAGVVVFSAQQAMPLSNRNYGEYYPVVPQISFCD
jgi:hypothetical protein|tara:strand:+ start:26 stop:223 length:198 start_codon:yes stop_codon:yes gene_type:complete